VVGAAAIEEMQPLLGTLSEVEKERERYPGSSLPPTCQFSTSASHRLNPEKIQVTWEPEK